MKTIPLIEPRMPVAYAQAVQSQILSGFLGPGPRTQEFSKELAAFVGASHLLLTVSGTIALSIAARALGLKSGDEILVPSYGVISTINAFSSIGLNPKLVEIERSTGCMSAHDLSKTISEKTKAVCFVNFSGYTGENLIGIKRICDEKGLPLIEDSACALGHSYNGIYSGLFGTVGIYSFSVPKILTTGQGGALLTNSSSIFNKAAAFIDQGDLEWRKTGVNREIGSNLRFNDILAALGLSQLRDIQELLEHRRTIFHILHEALEDFLFSVPGKEAPFQNIVFAEKPELLISELRKKGIAAARQYKMISSHPAYNQLDHDFPNANFWENHSVYLPSGMTLTEEDAAYIREAIITSGANLIKFNKED